MDKTSLQLPHVEEEVVAEQISLIKESGDVVFDDKIVPGAVAATPDFTPDSTLTSAEAEDLQDSFALNMAVQKIAPMNPFSVILSEAPS